MIFTNTNRYNINESELSKFFNTIKIGIMELRASNENYISDTYSYYTVEEYESMMRGEIYPFPEHVSLVNRRGLRDISKEDALVELEDLLKRPKIKNTIFN